MEKALEYTNFIKVQLRTGDFMKKVPWLPVCPRDR